MSTTTTTTRTQAAKLHGYGVRLFGAYAFRGINPDVGIEVTTKLIELAGLPETPASKMYAAIFLDKAYRGEAMLRHPNGKPIGPANFEQAYRSGMAYPEHWIRVNKRPAYVD